MTNPRSFTYTTQREVRAAFWESNPELSRKKIQSGAERIYLTDTRSAFVEFIDSLEKNGNISEALAQRATL